MDAQQLLTCQHRIVRVKRHVPSWQMIGVKQQLAAITEAIEVAPLLVSDPGMPLLRAADIPHQPQYLHKPGPTHELQVRCPMAHLRLSGTGVHALHEDGHLGIPDAFDHALGVAFDDNTPHNPAVMHATAGNFADTDIVDVEVGWVLRADLYACCCHKRTE